MMERLLDYLVYHHLAVFIACAVILLVYLAFGRRSTTSGKNGETGQIYTLPAGPWRWPILGNIPGMLMAGSSSKYMSDQVQHYGPAFTLYMGPRPVVVLNTYNVLKDALLDGHLLSNRGSLPALDSYFKGRGVIGSQFTDDWKRTRSFVINSLKQFGVNRQCFETVVASQAENLVEYIETTFNEDPTDPLHCLQASVCNVICGVVFAKQYEYDNPLFTHLLQTVHNSLRAVEYAAVSSLVPGLHYLPGCSYQTFYSCMDTLMEFFRAEIQEHDDLLDMNNPRDVIDLYLAEVRRTSPGDPTHELFTKTNLEFVVNDLFMAGTETTASVMYWAFLLIVSTPGVQEKLHNEIDDVTAHSDHVVMSDGNNMPYSKAVLEETIRYASVAISAIRSTTGDMTIDGHRIEVGTWVMLNYEYSSFDSKTWSEPRSFKPERFLDEQGEFHPNERLISFSIGKRNCLGERLARMELFLFLTNIFKNFDLVFPPDAPTPSIEAQKGGMTRAPINYRISFKKRTPSCSERGESVGI